MYIFLRVKFLGHRIILYLTFWGRLFSRVAAQFSNPVSSVWGFQLHILTNTCYYVVGHLLSHVWLFVIPWIIVHQAPLSSTVPRCLLKFVSIESVMLCNILSSAASISSCPQSFPASGSFPVSLLFKSGGQSIGVSAFTTVLPMNIQDWFPLGLTGLILLLLVFLMVALLVDVKCICLIMTLIFISLMMLSTSSCAYWPFAYFLWKNVYSNPLLTFKLGFLFLLNYKSSLYILHVSSRLYIYL